MSSPYLSVPISAQSHPSPLNLTPVLSFTAIQSNSCPISSMSFHILVGSHLFPISPPFLFNLTPVLSRSCPIYPGYYITHVTTHLALPCYTVSQTYPVSFSHTGTKKVVTAQKDFPQKKALCAVLSLYCFNRYCVILTMLCF
jgi:hypothetical protein